MYVALWDFTLLECSCDAGPAASCRTLEAHMANWIWPAFQFKPEMELEIVIRIIRAGVDTNENSAMARVLKVPQLTHGTSCDVIESGLMQIRRKGRQRIEFILYDSCCKLYINQKDSLYCKIHNYTISIIWWTNLVYRDQNYKLDDRWV